MTGTNSKKPAKRCQINCVLLLFFTITAFLYGVYITSYNKRPYTSSRKFLELFISRYHPVPAVNSSQEVLDKLNSSSLVQVHFIDVGHGNAIVLLDDDGTVIMIDSGNRYYSKEVVRYLEKLGVKKIDLFVITHYHNDHIGGVPAILETFMIKKFALSKYQPEYLASRFLRQIEGKVAYEHVGVGHTWQFGTIELRVVGPIREYEHLKGKPGFYVENNYSIVTQLVTPAINVLFMADAKRRAELDLVNSYADLKTDVLQVGHHGRYGSTTEELLDVSKPRYAIISTCGNYPYAHMDIISKLEQIGCKVLRTDHHGSIVLKATEKEYWFKVSRNHS